MRRERWTSSKVVNGTLESLLHTLVGNNQTDRMLLPLNRHLKLQRRRLIGPLLLCKTMSTLLAGLEGVIHHPTEAGGGAEAEAEGAIVASMTLEYSQSLETPLTQPAVHHRLKLKISHTGSNYTLAIEYDMPSHSIFASII